jgi:hypothetical protein
LYNLENNFYETGRVQTSFFLQRLKNTTFETDQVIKVSPAQIRERWRTMKRSLTFRRDLG